MKGGHSSPKHLIKTSTSHHQETIAANTPKNPPEHQPTANSVAILSQNARLPQHHRFLHRERIRTGPSHRLHIHNHRQAKLLRRLDAAHHDANNRLRRLCPLNDADRPAMSHHVRGTQDSRYDDDSHRVRCASGNHGEANSGTSVIGEGPGLDNLNCMMDWSSVLLRSTARLSTLLSCFPRGICCHTLRKWFRFASGFGSPLKFSARRKVTNRTRDHVQGRQQ